MTGPAASIEKTATNPDVQGHFGKLVRNLQKQTGELAVAGLMTLANWISSPAMAQEVPRVVWAGQESTRILQAWETPKKVIVTPGGQHTDQWPKYTVTSSVLSIDKTSDGRDFSKLAQAEVDALGRSEKKSYYTWKESQLDAANNQLDAANNQKQETNNQLANELLSDFDGKMRTFENLQKLYNVWKLSKNEVTTYLSLKNQLQSILASWKPEKIFLRLQSNAKYVGMISA